MRLLATRLPSILVLLTAVGSATNVAHAQGPCRTGLVPFDGAGELRRQVHELQRGVRLDAGVLRMSVTCRADSAMRSLSLGLVAPDVRLIQSDGVPDSRGDGAAWAGRGTSALLRMGWTLDWSVMHIAVVPEIWTSQNRPFDLLPGTDRSRVSLASPFYVGRNSLDLPSRMGRNQTTEFSPGQSTAWLEFRAVAVGWSSGNVWWGSGVRDALFIGPNAPGVPRVFTRTTRPVATPMGRLSAEYFFGYLTESRFFDLDPSNDRRSISAASVAWSPPHSDAFAIGVARGVIRRSPDRTVRFGRAMADVFSPAQSGPIDQLVSLFTRVAFPRSGLRAYGELARAIPISLRDILTAPNEGLAYQVGVQRLVRRRNASWLLHAEATNVEQGLTVAERPGRDFYSGTATPQGWTQRGQLLGAGIGPGGQSQWVAIDRLASRWSLGLYGERVRWNNDAFYRQFLPYPNRHDVSLRTGVRAGVRAVGYDASMDVSWGRRINYLFQNSTFLPNYRTVDVRIPQLRLSFTPITR